jgi:hypothetical protein
LKEVKREKLEIRSGKKKQTLSLLLTFCSFLPLTLVEQQPIRRTGLLWLYNLSVIAAAGASCYESMKEEVHEYHPRHS